jgi:hypothetical protein
VAASVALLIGTTSLARHIVGPRAQNLTCRLNSNQRVLLTINSIRCFCRMISLRLKNVRSLKDTGSVLIRPITILLGKNSSGKSTFARFFPLLRQSVEVNSNTPLLWYGRPIDFGTISEVISNITDDNTIFYEIKIPKSLFRRNYRSYNPSIYYTRTRNQFLNNIKNISFGITLSEFNEETKVEKLNISLDRDRVEITIDEYDIVDSISVNGVEFIDIFDENELFVDTRFIVPLVRFRTIRNEADGESKRRRRYENSVSKSIFGMFRSGLHGRFTAPTIRELIGSIGFDKKAPFKDRLDRIGGSYATWPDFLDYLGYRKRLERLRSLFLLSELPDLLLHIDGEASRIFLNIHYIGPSRATGERYYRIQELAVGEIDSRGENLAMFLTSLNSRERTNFSNWTEKYLGYAVEADRRAGHVSVMLREQGSKNWYNLADVGYGMSQVLPVFAQIWAQSFVGQNSSRYNLLVIEQPELHLHPAFQAKIGDALAGAIAERREREGEPSNTNRPPPHMIVETHSRQLVNRIGEMIKTGIISNSDVALYIFDKGSVDDPTTIEESSYDEDGDLRDWPYGFFSSD